MATPHPLPLPFQPHLFCLFQPEWSFPNTRLYRGNPSSPCLKTAQGAGLTLTALAPQVAFPPPQPPLHSRPSPRQHPCPKTPFQTPTPSKLPPAPGRSYSSSLSECPQDTPPIGDFLSSRFQPALTPQPGRPRKTADVQSKLNSAPAEHSSHFVMMPSLVAISAECNPPRWLNASCGQGPSAEFSVWH